MNIRIDKAGNTPIFVQICNQIRQQIRSGVLVPGERLPSMNQLAIMLDISRETVKKAYNALVRDNLLTAWQGKGIYVAAKDGTRFREILVLLDKQSVYNQIILRNFQETLEGNAHITILQHNQDVDLLEYYLTHNLDLYDYYVVSPHFPLDAQTQARATKIISRIPARKLIMLDNWLRGIPGDYGVVYQDFRNDAAQGLACARADILRWGGNLKVIVLPRSLYGNLILESVKDFARGTGIRLSVFRSIPETWNPGDVALVLNSQLDSGLVELDASIRSAGLVPGKDVKIISYNEMPLNELVMGGLTVLSTDFPAMGRTAADMILSGTRSKVHNPFRLIRRKSFLPVPDSRSR